MKRKFKSLLINSSKKSQDYLLNKKFSLIKQNEFFP